MKVIAVYNIKGGVGKTATAVNLSWLAAQGARVLLWDLDPQGAATFYYRIKPKVKGGLRDVLGKEQHLASHIKGTDFDNLDLLPADFSYRNMDLQLDHESKPTRQIRRALKGIENDYDFVILDCPPSISLVSENIFHAADALVVPTIPTTLSVRTLKQLLKFCRKNGLEKLPVWPFFSMVDRRKNMHKQIIETLFSKSRIFLRNSIPYASEVEQMGTTRKPLVSYRADSPVGEAYQRLWGEVLARLYLP